MPIQNESRFFPSLGKIKEQTWGVTQLAENKKVNTLAQKLKQPRDRLVC